MKKILCCLISAILLTQLCVQSFAAANKNFIKLNYDGKDTVTVSWNIDLTSAKKDFSDFLNGILKKGYTVAQIKENPDYAFLTEEIIPVIRFYCGSYYSCFPLDKTSGKKTFSVYSDIIPNFSAFADFSCGGTITADIVPAPESYPDGTEFCYNSLAVDCSTSFDVEPTGRIIYVQDENTVNKNPECFALPLTKDIILKEPTLKGNIFAGWTVKGKGIDRIKAGTEIITVVVNFTPCQYNINYVMTTDITYSFGRADNSKNPQTYTYGTSTPLYSVKSPVGGYTFYGWFLDGKLVTEIPAGTTGDVILYAKWFDDTQMAVIKLSQIYKAALDCSFCDLNTDGSVSVSDARLAIRIAIGKNKSTEEIRKRADTDNNGYVSVWDARKILRIATGKESIIDVYSAYCG